MTGINQLKQKSSTYTLRSAMRTNLQAYWQEAASYQKVAYYAATLMFLSGIFHLGVLVVTGDSLSGDVSFRKPTTFGLSFGLTVATITWFLTFFTKNRTLAWLTLMPPYASSKLKRKEA